MIYHAVTWVKRDKAKKREGIARDPATIQRFIKRNSPVTFNTDGT
jgi:hypothetical protein